MFATVITTYNRSYCVTGAIDSALREFPDDNIYVIDDASTDNTSELIKIRYSKKLNSQIYYSKLELNTGVTGAKNYGYGLVGGGWVSFLDSDDMYLLGAGPLIRDELAISLKYPIIFFRCISNLGIFVGHIENKPRDLDLKSFISYKGEALTIINKDIVKSKPYSCELRGYEGLGCARIIKRYGPARLSMVVARIYDRSSKDSLSGIPGLLPRLLLIAKGHLLMVREFSSSMKFSQLLGFILKAFLYLIVGYLYRILKV